MRIWARFDLIDSCREQARVPRLRQPTPGETGASGFGRDNGLGARVSEPAPHWSVSVSRLARMSLRGSVGFLVFGLGLIRGGGWAIARLRGVFEVPPEVSQPSGQQQTSKTSII